MKVFVLGTTLAKGLTNIFSGEGWGGRGRRGQVKKKLQGLKRPNILLAHMIWEKKYCGDIYLRKLFAEEHLSPPFLSGK